MRVVVVDPGRRYETDMKERKARAENDAKMARFEVGDRSSFNKLLCPAEVGDSISNIKDAFTLCFAAAAAAFLSYRWRPWLGRSG